MVVTILILILATLLFGAAAIRGAMAKLLIFAALAIGVTFMLVWFGEDVYTTLLWILLVLLGVLWVLSKVFDWDRHLKP